MRFSCNLRRGNKDKQGHRMKFLGEYPLFIYIFLNSLSGLFFLFFVLGLRRGQMIGEQTGRVGFRNV